MKRFGVAVCSTVLWLSLSAIAQYAGQSSTSDQQVNNAQATGTQTTTQTTSSEGSSGKLHKLKGKISDDGKTFTSAKDNKTWTIVNPDAVKGHEGHEATLSAHVYSDKGEIHVMSVKMGGEKSSTKSKGEQSPY